MILNLINQGGPVMWALFGGAFIAFSLIFYKSITILTLAYHHRKLHKIDQIAHYIEQNQFEEAKSLCLAHGPIKKLIERGIHCIESNHHNKSIKDQLEMIYDEEIHKLDNGLSIILILGEIMPMLGLLGTVTGMIHVFQAISAYGTSNAQGMAAGISEALLTTQTGLILALPILLFYTLLTQQIDNLSKKMRTIGSTIITAHQQHPSQKSNV